MENNNVKVSVIIPVYNAYDYLRPAIDSILDQTLTELEVICIDDGSTDNSLEILKEYQERDPRVRIVTETNAGPGIARNNGIKRARGEYLAFLDADDFYEPTFLEELYTVAVRDSLDIAIARYDFYNNESGNFEPAPHADHSEVFSPDAVTARSDEPDVILASTVSAPWNKLFRKSFVLDMGLTFLTNVKIYEDVYFVVTALAMAGRIGKVHKPLMHHRIHSGQTYSKLFAKQFKNVPFVFARIKEFLVSRGTYSPLVRSYLNLSVDRIRNVFNILPSNLKDDFWDLLHKEYIDKLGWRERETSDFDTPELYDFIACVELYTYSDYKKSVRRRALWSDKPEQTSAEVAKRRKRIRSFFRHLFGKK